MQFVEKKENFCPPHLLTREQNRSGSMLALDVVQCESTRKIEITQVNYFESTQQCIVTNLRASFY